MVFLPTPFYIFSVVPHPGSWPRHGPSSGTGSPLEDQFLSDSPFTQALVTPHLPTVSLGPKEGNGFLLLLISRLFYHTSTV